MNHRRYTYLVGEDILLLKRRYTSFLRETHRLLMRGRMGALLLWLLTLTACVGEELQKPLLGEGEGYLTLQVGAISAEVTSSTLTKATVPNAPTEEQLTIKITNTSTREYKTYNGVSAVPKLLVLKAGVTYTVEASSGTNYDLQEIPYFYDRQEVTIQANTNNPVTVTATLKNAMIIPDISSLQKHYNDDWTLTASTTSNATMTLSFTDGKCTFYAKAGETVSLNFKGTNKAGEKADATWKSISNVEACKAYTVQCNPNLTAFENIQVTATATHTDRDGNLNGTEVTFSADLHEANEKAIDSWTVKVCKSDGQIIRTYTGKSLSSMTYSDTGWPYIPQGSTLSASVKLKAGDEITVGSTFALQPPTFEVKVTGTTSYDLYKAEKISEANGMDAGTIKGIGAKAKIANALLSNPNYSHTFTLTYGDDKYFSKTDTITVGDKTGQSWGNHPITATMVFDGQSIEAKKDCHITGLPFINEPPTTTYWSATEGKITWEDNDVQFGLNSGWKSCTIQSKSFHVPSDIDINLAAKFAVRHGTFDNTFSIYLGSELAITETNTAWNSTKDYTKDVDKTITLSNNFIKCNNSYGFSQHWSYLYKVNILYR